MELPGPVDPLRPIANGICFSDMHGLSADDCNSMAATGGVFLTEFRAVAPDGPIGTWGGDIIATDRETAERRAAERGLGEVILGQLASMIAAEEGDEPPILPGTPQVER